MAAWLGLLALAVLVQAGPWAAQFDHWLFDTAMGTQRKPVVNPAPPVIIGIDSETFQRYREPIALWHQHIGDLFAAASAAGARLVVTDLVLPDRSYEFLIPGQDRKLLQGLLAARGHTPVVLGLSIENRTTRELFRPIRLLAGGVGLSLIQVDADERARRLLPALSDGSAELPSLPAEAARLLGYEPVAGLIDYRLGAPYAYLPLQQVLDWYRAGERKTLRERLQDRVLLLGSVLDDTDLHRAPVPLAEWLGTSTLVPGMLIHAQSLRTWVADSAIQPLPRFWAALIGVLLAAVVYLLRPRGRGLAFAALLCLAPMVLAWGALEIWPLWMAPGPTTLGALTGLLSRGAVEGAEAVRESRLLRNRFGRYVSPAVLGSILRGDLDGSAAPVRRRVCVLFADIRDFTTRSEAVEAETIAALLNRYFETVVTAIHEHGGTVDKFMGDGIMAFFGAPAKDERPSLAAIAAAQGMRTRVAHLNQELTRDGVEPIRIGIGLHAGDAVIGHIGSSQRQEYTAIGDTVNIASRVEGLCKTTGCAIVCTQAVFDEARPEGAEALGQHPIKGHTPIQVYGWR